MISVDVPAAAIVFIAAQLASASALRWTPKMPAGCPPLHCTLNKNKLLGENREFIEASINLEAGGPHPVPTLRFLTWVVSANSL